MLSYRLDLKPSEAELIQVGGQPRSHAHTGIVIDYQSCKIMQIRRLRSITEYGIPVLFTLVIIP